MRHIGLLTLAERFILCDSVGNAQLRRCNKLSVQGVRTLRFRVIGAGLTCAILTLAGHQAFADAGEAAKAAPAMMSQAVPESSFVSKEFTVPTLVEATSFKIVPLGPDLVKIDFDAYMSSIEHLQKTFTRSLGWPHKDVSAADAMRDMENEQARFEGRKSFAYAVLTPDGKRERGCVYVYPSTVKGYDAVVRMWVTKAEYGAGFDAELYNWVTDWMRKDWPFRIVAYPGRSIEWAAWDSMVAAKQAGPTVSKQQKQ